MRPRVLAAPETGSGRARGSPVSVLGLARVTVAVGVAQGICGRNNERGTMDGVNRGLTGLAEETRVAQSALVADREREEGGKEGGRRRAAKG